MVILISYDLNKHERPEAYEKVKKMIEDSALDSRRPLYSQWFVETSSSLETWYDRMKKVTDNNDNFFIIQINRPYKGWLDGKIWPWLKDRI